MLDITIFALEILDDHNIGIQIRRAILNTQLSSFRSWMVDFDAVATVTSAE